MLIFVGITYFGLTTLVPMVHLQVLDNQQQQLDTKIKDLEFDIKCVEAGNQHIVVGDTHLCMTPDSLIDHYKS